MFGLQPIEALFEQGIETRRGIYIDDYGNPRVAIEFMRDASGQTQVRVSFPWDRSYGFPTRRMDWSAPVSEALWLEAQALDLPPKPLRSRNGLKPATDDQGEPAIIICLHGRTGLAESVVRGRSRFSTSSTMANACDDARPFRYVSDLGLIARKAIPNCTLLKPDDFRTYGLLNQCILASRAGAPAFAILRETLSGSWLDLTQADTRLMINGDLIRTGKIDAVRDFNLKPGDPAQELEPEVLEHPYFSAIAADPRGGFTAQIGLFRYQVHKDKIVNRLRALGTMRFTITGGETIQVAEIRVGAFARW